MTRVYVALGANVGDRLAALRAATARLGDRADTRVVATSAVYETEAHVQPGTPPQPDHLNAVVALDTRLSPRALLRTLHGLERAAGRDHARPRWAPRPLDLDVLLYGRRQIDVPGLTVPHPSLAVRRFVLQPLADVAPDLVVPGHDHTVAELLARTPDAARLARAPGDLR